MGMSPSKVHCFFEQSGTFKNEFLALGYPSEDYDIQNEFGETDHVIDLFREIEKGYNREQSIFDTITKDELIIAFFPCVRFEDQVLLLFRGESYSQRTWSEIQKIEYCMSLQQELTRLYIYISQLVVVCLKKGIPLIVENPYSTQHYLTQRWCVRPALIDYDRRDRGDRFKKPTQYWFFNCEPSWNFIWEPQIMWDEYLSVENSKKTGDINRTTLRSMITHEYANRFIREFIL